MENKLRRVFDYQKFNANSRLGAMIAETERRYQALNDDDLFLGSGFFQPTGSKILDFPGIS